MNREVHVRFWESPEVKVLRATRPSRHLRLRDLASALRALRKLIDGRSWPTATLLTQAV
jgi:hypothetical protein